LRRKETQRESTHPEYFWEGVGPPQGSQYLKKGKEGKNQGGTRANPNRILIRWDRPFREGHLRGVGKAWKRFTKGWGDRTISSLT